MKLESKRGRPSLEVKSLDESPRSFSLLLDPPPSRPSQLTISAESENAKSGAIGSSDIDIPKTLSPFVGESITSSSKMPASPSKDTGFTSINDSTPEDDQDPLIDESNDINLLERNDIRFLSLGDKIKKSLGEPSYKDNSKSGERRDPCLTSKDAQYDKSDDNNLLNERKVVTKSPQNIRDRDLPPCLSLSETRALLPASSIEIVKPKNDDQDSNDEFSYDRSNIKEEADDDISFEKEQERNDVSESKSYFVKESRAKVTFTKIFIREYPRIVGDNPACSSGAPISIGWSYNTKDVISVNEYEQHREGVRRDISSMKMPKSIREIILKDEWDVSMKELMIARSETLKIQQQRKETIDQLSRRKKLTRRFSLCVMICKRGSKLETITIED